MASTIAYRLLLIGLLPVIAGLLYLEGQSYDPALIQFKHEKSAPDLVLSFFPTEIDGFSRRGDITVYTSENLYEYVNGHAEYFISAGFKTLAVAEYGRAGGDDNSPDAVVDIYDMGRSIYAFGILSDESGGRAHMLKTGVTGLETEQGGSFITGRYYVRIAAYAKDIPLDVFIRTITRLTGPAAGPVVDFSALPDFGEVVRTSFVREAYRGLPFLNNVIEREYDFDGESFQVFFFEGSESDTDKLVGSFIDFFLESEIEYDVIENAGVKMYKVRDPYEGDWMLIPISGKVFGIYGGYNDEVIDFLLKGELNEEGK